MGRFETGLCGLPLSALVLACSSALAAHVDPSLTRQAQRGGLVEALITLPDQAAPVLAPLDTNVDYKVRRRALVDALRARATTQQAALRAWLDARGVEYKPYWIANMLWARLSEADLAAIGGRPDVSSVEPNPLIPMHLPRPTDTDSPQRAAPDTISWGVTKINAPAVWAAGFNGQGVVIAGEDTGYQWDHPALKPHYRGWDGTTADHNFNWHDAIHDSSGNPCGNDSPAPCDDFGHGTHTAGTFAGDDGGSHQIGVAPGAKWIGCRNMDNGAGTPTRYIECMEWMLAPTDLNNANPNPDLAPDIVSNSWGCTFGEGCTVGDEIEAAVNNVVAGGIFFVVAAGNGASTACGLIANPPAIYDASFVVGATGNTDALANFSLRGPVAGSSLIRPDISGPGVNICSSIPTNAYSCSYSGTSMATPHVAGSAALLLSVNPALKGHPDQVAAILRATAATAGVSDPVNQTCGGTSGTQWPNNMLGYGRVDAYAAAVMADTLFKDGFDGAAGP